MTIRMGVGVDGVKQFRRKEFRQGDVLLGLVELRIDDDALLFLRTAENVGKTTAGTYLLEERFITSHHHLERELNAGHGSLFQVVAIALYFV
jgi:hypothetical protein